MRLARLRQSQQLARREFERTFQVAGVAQPAASVDQQQRQQQQRAQFWQNRISEWVLLGGGRSKQIMVE